MSKPMTIERLQGIFKKYKVLDERMNRIRMDRKSDWGIAVKTDHYALEWQKLAWRHHVLQVTLEGKPLNWYYADWIDNDERDRRNKLKRSVIC